MNRTTVALLTSAALVVGSAVTVNGQGKKASAPKPQHVTTSKLTTTKVSSTKTMTSPKTTGSKKTTTVSQSSKGPKTTTAKATKTTKTTKTASSHTTKSAKADTKKTTKVAKVDTKPSKSEKTSTTTTTTTTTTTSGDGDTPLTLTKVQEKLQKNTKLADKLESRLPVGTDLMEAAEGFRNLGQFVAAVNVSNNLGLDFEKLRTAMVDDGKSLGQAIQSVKQDVDSPTVVAQRAESEAQTLIQQTETQATSTKTTTTSTTTTKTKSKDKPKRTLRTQSGS